MPELPEVETIVRGLRRVLPGRSITSLHLGKTDFIDDPAALADLLPGRRIASVERLGKFIRLPLAPSGAAENSPAELSLMVHLGMTGRLGVYPPDAPIPPHTHGIFSLDDGNELRYTDIRRFGRIALFGDDAIQSLLKQLGEDPLDISSADFSRRLGSRRARIKALLLDQSVLRGVGNIYADESLWRARVHPARLGAQLGKDDLTRLWRSLQEVLRAAILHRGSSVSDFLDAQGKPGSYQRRHRVYQRADRPCPRCGTPIRRATIAGRSSHFCPRCQPPPRAHRAASKNPAPAKRRAPKEVPKRKTENANRSSAGQPRKRNRRRAHHRRHF